MLSVRLIVVALLFLIEQFGREEFLLLGTPVGILQNGGGVMPLVIERLLVLVLVDRDLGGARPAGLEHRLKVEGLPLSLLGLLSG